MAEVLLKPSDAISSNGSETVSGEFVVTLHPAPEIMGLLTAALEADRAASDPESDDFDEDRDPGQVLGSRVVDAGNTVDGEPWVWCYLTDGRWWLLPAGIASADSTVFEMGMHQGWSMVGGTSTAGCRFVPPVVLAYTATWVEESEAAPTLELAFDPGDRSTLLRLVDGSISWMASGCGPSCPACEEWTLEIAADVPDPISMDVVGSAISAVWQPCEHHGGPGDLYVEVAGWNWAWSGGAWSVVPDTS